MAYRKPHQDEVIVHWIGGTRLAARRGMTGLTGNIYAGLHEFADMAFLLHFLRPSDLFADVGANVGSYTILASGVVRCPTVAQHVNATSISTESLIWLKYESLQSENAKASFAFQRALTRKITLSRK